jgi:hypothetical protein
LAKFAATCGMSLTSFREHFEAVVQAEPPPLKLRRAPAEPAEPQSMHLTSPTGRGRRPQAAG